MNRKFLGIIVLLSLTLFCTEAALAGHGKGRGKHRKNHMGKVNTPRERRADDNHDGRVGPREAKEWRKEHHENHGNNDPRVNQPWERKADDDRDGIVEKDERKEFITDRQQVDKPWEERADKNDDGIVDKKETGAAAIKKKSKVSQPWEKAADVNQDGFVSGEEAKMWREGRR